MKSRAKAAGSRALSWLHRPVGKWNLKREILHAGEPLRIELGAWTTRRPGWVSTDVHWRCRCYLDGTRPWPVATDSVAYLFADNVIEHVGLPANRTLLREAYRVLKPGGMIRLVTPDIGALVELYRAGPAAAAPLMDELVDEGYFVAHQVDVLRFAFQDDGHHTGYLWDYDSLAAELMEAGFVDVRSADPGLSSEPDLRGLELRLDTPVSGIMAIVEARKRLEAVLPK